MFYTGEKKSLESTDSNMGSRRVSSCTRLYPFYNDEPPYYLEVSQIPNQSPIPFQSNFQTPLERHSLSPGIDPAITELVPSDILGIEQTPLESDFIRKAAASNVQHIPQSPKFLSNSPRRGSILKRGKHGKETKGKKKAKSRTLEQLKDGENRSVDEVPPALKNTCPDEERFIFECQWYHRHKSDEDMWDSIQDDFWKTFNQKHSREVLRMKFGRAKSKYIQWFPQDVSPDFLSSNQNNFRKDSYANLTFNLGRHTSKGVGTGGARSLPNDPRNISSVGRLPQHAPEFH